MAAADRLLAGTARLQTTQRTQHLGHSDRGDLVRRDLGPYYYRLPNSDDLLPVIRARLSDTGTMYDFSAEIKNRYGLVPLDESEVERILPDLRIEN